MYKLGIIGYGNFGRFAATHLKGHFDVVAYDTDPKTGAKHEDIRRVDLKMAATQPFVLLCVPVQSLENVLQQTAQHVKSGALVVDVASVKQKPAALMEKILPKTVQLIGTHPLFGPQSGKDGLKGLPIVLCPIRADAKTLDKTREFLQALGLDVIEMTPTEHDQWMAKTQAVAHFVGRAAKEMDLPDAPFNLATYDALLKLRDLVKDDSDALFDTIENENPFAAKEREALRGKLDEIESRLHRQKKP